MDQHSPTATAATTDHVEASIPENLQEGIRIAANAAASPLINWLTGNPELAGELARFLAAERDLQRIIGPPAVHDSPGSRLGRYELCAELGRGGMGIVYRAYDPLLKREVALKRMLIEPFQSPEALARFRFEAEAVASLNHANIVGIHDWDDANGTPYLVMPLLKCSMAAWLKALGPDRCLPPKVAAEIVRDLALAVHHAHQRGLLHRDLKPGNVLLDDKDKPHVADFGLARPLDGSVSGGVVGTAAYMAPEQARGEKSLTTAVDIHALGAILFELLTGAPPFGTGEFAVVLRRVIDEAAPSIQQARPGISADLAWICRRCLEKQPQDRYASSAELAQDLDRFLHDIPIERNQRGIIRSITRALVARRETQNMGSWPIAFWGTGWSLVAVDAIQAAVLMGLSVQLVLACLGTYFVGWFAVIWVFLVARREALNLVERGSLALHLGMFFAATAMMCGQLWLSGGDVLAIFPPLTALLGFSVFAHGVHYWGRLFAIGLFAILVAAAMPLVPMNYWPSVYGLTVCGCQAWAGFVLRRYHRAATAAANRWRIEASPPSS
jgi:eukaryotic-like serine/threonine-protein kinase